MYCYVLGPFEYLIDPIIIEILKNKIVFANNVVNENPRKSINIFYFWNVIQLVGYPWKWIMLDRSWEKEI